MIEQKRPSNGARIPFVQDSQEVESLAGITSGTVSVDLARSVTAVGINHLLAVGMIRGTVLPFCSKP